eukprot:scaffold6879_cov105-Cyclotella_meneghiniana.AAC.4
MNKQPTTRADSGLYSSFKNASEGGNANAKWVCDCCGEIIDKRKYSHDEAAEMGYEKDMCSGACDHAEQTLRIIDN